MPGLEPDAAMTVTGRALKRANRRVTADLPDLLTFPAADACACAAGPFRHRVREFLARYARPPPLEAVGSPVSLLTWRVAFRVGDDDDDADVGEESQAERSVVELIVVEEDVQRSRRSVYCDQCQIVGWSGHPVCAKRYHFIIRNEDCLSPNHRACRRCGMLMHMMDRRCTSCSNELSAYDIEDWQYQQLENATHLLHGIVHKNGYGHLLRINGRQGGSKILTGTDIVAFWDRLCKMLCVRKITVMDKSKKYDIEYRLLHAVVTGRPWYGNWGYEFDTGSFGLTAEAYHKSVENLSDVPLSLFFTHARSPRTQLQDTISFYWSLTGSSLVTVRDLFRYVLDLIHDAGGSLESSEGQGKQMVAEPVRPAPGVHCVWTSEDIERAENAIVKVLKAVTIDRSRWVSWRALMGATCHSIASLELLDYCLKGLPGKCFVPNMIVAVRCSADTHAIEYRLQTVSNLFSKCSRPSKDHLSNDLRFLYRALLNPATMLPYRPLTTREAALSSASKILDCKQLVKHYDQQNSRLQKPLNPFALHIWCHVELLDQPKDMTIPPELLILQQNATIADLKYQASKVFRESYVLFQRFHAEQLLEYQHLKDSTPVKLILSHNGVVRVRGTCIDLNRLWNFRMERGVDNWTVNCACGAKDDDGERMMACDVCEVWWHTRCAGIRDNEEPPAKFTCALCATLDMKVLGFVGGRCKGLAPFNTETECYGHGHHLIV